METRLKHIEENEITKLQVQKYFSSKKNKEKYIHSLWIIQVFLSADRWTKLIISFMSGGEMKNRRLFFNSGQKKSW